MLIFIYPFYKNVKSLEIVGCTRNKNFMILHIIRHGKTNQESPTDKDFDRELLEKGIKQSELLGDYVKAPADCVVYCSSARRTIQTFEIANKSWDLKHVNIVEDLYLCSRDHLLKLVFSQEHNHDLMIVGHNFGISDLASYFLEDNIELRTGEYLALEFDIDNWKEASRGLATIRDRYRPRVDL